MCLSVSPKRWKHCRTGWTSGREIYAFTQDFLEIPMNLLPQRAPVKLWNLNSPWVVFFFLSQYLHPFMNVNCTVNSAFVLSCSTSFHAVQASKQEEEGQNLETKHRYLEVMAERCQGHAMVSLMYLCLTFNASASSWESQHICNNAGAVGVAVAPIGKAESHVRIFESELEILAHILCQPWFVFGVSQKLFHCYLGDICGATDFELVPRYNLSAYAWMHLTKTVE